MSQTVFEIDEKIRELQKTRCELVKKQGKPDVCISLRRGCNGEIAAAEIEVFSGEYSPMSTDEQRRALSRKEPWLCRKEPWLLRKYDIETGKEYRTMVSLPLDGNPESSRTKIKAEIDRLKNLLDNAYIEIENAFKTK